jgi:two-component system sensor histidine kinase BarA
LAETGSGVRLLSDVRADEKGSVTGALLRSRTAEVTAPIRLGGRTLGRVVLLGRLPDERAMLGASLGTSLLAALLAVLGGLAVAARLQRSITAPVKALTTSMRRIEETHD